MARASLNGLSASAGSSGFADTLREAIRELQGALLEPDRVDGDLAHLYSAYRAELETLGLWDRELRRAHAVARLEADLDAWHGEPVFAYGFEDLTEAEWSLLEALAGRTEVTVSLPYEPGRAAFESLRRTAEDLAALADGIEELPPASADVAEPAIAYLERSLFDEPPGGPPPIAGAIGFFEGAGVRGALELVGDEILELVRGGFAPEAIGVICPSLGRWRAPLETVFGTLGIPYAFEAGSRFGETAVRPRAPLAAPLRVARRACADLFAFLRSPYSGLSRNHVDFVEGRLRGRAVAAPGGSRRSCRSSAGAPLRSSTSSRAGVSPVEAVARPRAGDAPRGARARAPAGRHRPRRGPPRVRRCASPPRRARPLGAARRRADERRRRRRDARARAAPARARRAGQGVGARPRPRADARFDVVFVLGLEEEPSRAAAAARRSSTTTTRERLGGRLQRADPVSRDRYLFYTACARPDAAALPRPRVRDRRGQPARGEPVLGRGAVALPARGGRARDDAPPPLRAHVAAREAPTERERLRALASIARDEPADADGIARANGWERRLARARAAPTARRDCATRSSSRPSPPARRSPSPSSSAWPTARPRGSSTA